MAFVFKNVQLVTLKRVVNSPNSLFVLVHLDCLNGRDSTWPIHEHYPDRSLATGSRRYYMSIALKLNWFKAHQYCQLHGMNLATVYNKEEQDEMLQYLDRIGWEGELVWIGASDLGEEGQYWYVGDGAPVNYTDWLEGRPLENDDEYCVHMWQVGGNFGWKDGNCNVPLHFACDIKKEATVLGDVKN